MPLGENVWCDGTAGACQRMWRPGLLSTQLGDLERVGKRRIRHNRRVRSDKFVRLHHCFVGSPRSTILLHEGCSDSRDHRGAERQGCSRLETGPVGDRSSRIDEHQCRNSIRMLTRSENRYETTHRVSNQERGAAVVIDDVCDQFCVRLDRERASEWLGVSEADQIGCNHCVRLGEIVSDEAPVVRRSFESMDADRQRPRPAVLDDRDRAPNVNRGSVHPMIPRPSRRLAGSLLP